jgi:L-ribulose-5-phosphate 3-epimerase
MKNCIGIMQGRLSPPIDGRIQAFPWDSWEREFFHAREVGLDLIDWIVECERFNENPLLTEGGSKAIKSVISETGVSIGAVCADYFMDCPLLRCSSALLKERLEALDLIISRLNYFGIKYLEIPFVDNSAIKDTEELEQIKEIIRPRLEEAYRLGVTLAFETSLPVETFHSFLLSLDHPAARANYDTGNSASLGYNPRDELEAYGELVVTVHIKDRILKGGTVPLGQGHTDFGTCFSVLRAKNYAGPFILQVARSGDEIEAARKNMAFVERFLGE